MRNKSNRTLIKTVQDKQQIPPKVKKILLRAAPYAVKNTSDWSLLCQLIYCLFFQAVIQCSTWQRLQFCLSSPCFLWKSVSLNFKFLSASFAIIYSFAFNFRFQYYFAPWALIGRGMSIFKWKNKVFGNPLCFILLLFRVTLAICLSLLLLLFCCAHTYLLKNAANESKKT